MVKTKDHSRPFAGYLYIYMLEAYNTFGASHCQLQNQQAIAGGDISHGLIL